jgi:peptidoglycan-associated lipoprotein
VHLSNMKKETLTVTKTANNRRALSLTLIAVGALAVSACATKKPMATTAPPPPPSAGAPAPGPRTQPPAPPVGQSTLPGSEQDFVVNVGERVYFDFDSYTIRADATPLLEGQAAWLRRYTAVMIRIEGNADERGTREYNLALGARRANTVRDFLVSKGVTANRITTISYGKERPIDTGDTDQAHEHNRNARTGIVSGAR